MRTRLFTPKGFTVAAVVLVLLYAIVSVCGLREHVSAFALTPPPGVSREVAFAGCLAYLAAYFAAILLVPVLVIAAALWSLARALRARAGRRAVS